MVGAAPADAHAAPRAPKRGRAAAAGLSREVWLLDRNAKPAEGGDEGAVASSSMVPGRGPA